MGDRLKGIIFAAPVHLDGKGSCYDADHAGAGVISGAAAGHMDLLSALAFNISILL